MTYPTSSIRVLVCCLGLALAAAAAHAATANGKVVHANGTPAQGITITLANNQGRSNPAQSDSNGAFTLSNVPAGRYYLEVWVDPKSPQTYPVTITEPNTSLPQVKVP
jgi:hypothetical protein